MATYVYIKKVNGSSCAKQPNQLFKGADDKHAGDLRTRRLKLGRIIIIIIIIY